jgi:UPF0716 protein FxsA
MKPRIRFAAAAYLLLEIWATLEVATWLGAGRTLLLLIAGAIAGIAVLRRERLTIVSQLRRGADLRQAFVSGLPDRALRTMAGLLLIIPGFLSDAAALILLVPRSRRWVVRRFAAGFVASSRDPTIIEGEFHRIDEPALPENKQDHR